MRVARTFTIDIDLVQELRRKVNQSETVCRALRKYLGEDQEYDLRDVSIWELIGTLQSRFERDSAESKLYSIALGVLATS